MTEQTSHPRRTLQLSLAVGLVLVLLLSLLGLGLHRVPEGQVAVLPRDGGGAAAVWEPGWHWSAPWGPEPLPLPLEAVMAERDVVLTTAEGAEITLQVTGRLAVSDGGAAEWLAAAGRRPFLEGVDRVVGEALAPEIRSTDPAELFREDSLGELAGRARAALENAGVEVTSLAVAAPVEKNPVAVAVARSRVTRLARPTGQKVMVVGWDGADWLMMRPLLEQGRLPNVARLVKGGVSGDLRSEEPLLSPLIWTTMATGKPVAEHGIADFLVKDAETGSRVPIGSDHRRVHALWTLLPAFDLTTDVVAWWATWPAERVQGTMVTDRVAYQLFDYEEGSGDGDAAGKVYPPDAWPAIREELVSAEEIGADRLSRFVDVDAAEVERRWESLPPERRQEDPVNHLRKIVATTSSYHRIALSLLEDQADLSLFYYEGTDTVGHRFARFLPPRMAGVSDEEVAKLGGALPAFYEWCDELLGELLAAAGDDTLVILVSDHGFFTGAARPEGDPADFAGAAPQWHRLHGVLVGDGPGVDRAEVKGASIYDLAPTVLAALGLPVPRDMEGRILDELLPPAARRAVPDIAGELASYEVLPRTRRSEARVASADDEERLRELVALGYISAEALEDGGGDGAGDTERPGGEPTRAEGATTANRDGTDTGGPQGQGLATEAYNLGRIAQKEGRLDEAERYYRQAVERMPSFGTAWASLAQVSARRGDHSQAFDRLVEGFTRTGNMPRAAVTGLVDEANRCGRLADAERVLEGLRSSLSGVSAYHAAWGLLHESRGDLEAALDAYERALDLEPLEQFSVEQKVAVLRQLGRDAAARSFLTASFDRARTVNDMNQLAVAALRQGWPADAERLLRRVLESDPGNPGVLANLAASLARQGKMAEAAQVMGEAVERDPGNAGNQFNLGAMLAAQGRAGEALEHFEEAMELGLRTPRVHVAAAKMHFRLGDPAAAEEDLEAALRIAPDDREARQLLTVLRQGGG